MHFPNLYIRVHRGAKSDDSNDTTSQSQPGWKPFTLQAPFLLILTSITALSIVAIEVIVQTSGQGYAISNRFVDRDGTGATFFQAGGFASLYLPTLLAVLYSLTWTWVSLPFAASSSVLCVMTDQHASSRMTRSVLSHIFSCRRKVAVYPRATPSF